MDLQNKVAVVTGAAGGMGSVIAGNLAASGYKVIVTDLMEDAVAAAAERTGATGSFSADLTQEEAVRGLAEYVSGFGPVMAVVNAAGVSPKNKGGKLTYDMISAAEWSHVMAVNLMAPFLVIRELAPYMTGDGTASIVNIGSIVARLGTSGGPGASFPPFITSGAHYAASKAGLHNLGMALARELAPLNIRVNTVAPGYIDTPMSAATGSAGKARVLDQIPAGRAGGPDDISNAIEFLLSPRSAYMTGAVLDVNGGWLPAF